MLPFNQSELPRKFVHIQSNLKCLFAYAEKYLFSQERNGGVLAFDQMQMLLKTLELDKYLKVADICDQYITRLACEQLYPQDRDEIRLKHEDGILQLLYDIYLNPKESKLLIEELPQKMTLLINHAYTKKAVITKALLITLSSLICNKTFLLQKQLSDSYSLIIDRHPILKVLNDSIGYIKITLENLFTKTKFVGSYEQVDFVATTNTLTECFENPNNPFIITPNLITKESIGPLNEQLPNGGSGKCKARDDKLTIAVPQKALNPPPQDDLSNPKLTDFSSDKATDRCISSTPGKLASSDKQLPNITTMSKYKNHTYPYSYEQIWNADAAASDLNRAKAILEDYIKGGWLGRLLTFHCRRHHADDVKKILNGENRDIRQLLENLERIKYKSGGSLAKRIDFISNIANGVINPDNFLQDYHASMEFRFN